MSKEETERKPLKEAVPAGHILLEPQTQERLSTGEPWAACAEASSAGGPSRTLAAQRSAALRLMRGDVGGALDVLAGAGALTADFVSMAAAGGRRVWAVAVRALAAQLEAQGADP